MVVRSSGSGICLGSTGKHRRAAQARQRKKRVEEKRHERLRACECDKRVCCLLVACKEGMEEREKQETRGGRGKIRIKYVDEHKKRNSPVANNMSPAQRERPKRRQAA